MKNALLNELGLFRRLTFVARQLLVSSTIYELAYPILFTFLSAFLFRATGGFLVSVLYNIGMMVGLPLVFYANGVLLKYVNIKWMFLIGLIGQGLVAGSVFFFNTVTPVTVFLVGFLQAFPMGFYWSNRNFITLEVTNDGDRAYYSGLEQVVTNLAGVISPLITGWILVFGAHWSALSLRGTYQLLAIVATLGLIWGGLSFMSAQVENPVYKKLWLGFISSPWNKARVRELLNGMENGMKIVLPPLLILFAVGTEATLGSLLSLAAVVSAAIMYVLARKINSTNRKATLCWVLIGNFVMATAMAITFSLPTILLFLLLMPTLHQLTWVTHSPIQMKVMDDEDGGDPTNNYAYIADRELFLNLGRLLGIGLFMALFMLVSNEAALRFTPFAIGAAQLGILLLL